MKIITLALAGAVLAGSAATSVPALAQPRDHDRYERHDDRRDRHRAHKVRVCHTEWRHHHKVRACRMEWHRW